GHCRYARPEDDAVAQGIAARNAVCEDVAVDGQVSDQPGASIRELCVGLRVAARVVAAIEQARCRSCAYGSYDEVASAKAHASSGERDRVRALAARCTQRARDAAAPGPLYAQRSVVG